jgi:hypothetical protein
MDFADRPRLISAFARTAHTYTPFPLTYATSQFNLGSGEVSNVSNAT